MSLSINTFLSVSGTVFSARPSGERVQLIPSPKSGSAKGVTYALWNDRGAYVGKTDQTFRKRLSQHASSINRHDPATRASRAYEVLSQSPMKIQFAILDSDPTLSLEDQEKLAIAAVPEEYRLNSNRGGGGGTARKSRNFDENADPEVYETPEKYFPLKRYDGQPVKFELSPKTAQSRDVVYVIKNEQTGEKYVGTTVGPLKRRMGEHARDAKSSRKKRIKGSLHFAMAKHPEHFVAGILAKNVSDPEERFQLEKEMIESKDSYYKGYNQNKGGGGSS